MNNIQNFLLCIHVLVFRFACEVTKSFIFSENKKTDGVFGELQTELTNSPLPSDFIGKNTKCTNFAFYITMLNYKYGSIF